MRRSARIALLAGLLPVVAAHGAYLVNIAAGDGLEPRFICMPYLEGCVSISRASRSGPGLYLFRALMLPCTVMLWLSWQAVRTWLLERPECKPWRARAIFLLGAVGALFLVFYLTALGTEGEWYRWMRRYGVTFYFSGTALAQLLLVAVLWPHRREMNGGCLLGPVNALMALVSLQWVLGVLSVLKHVFFSNPELVDRFENIIEWWFALPMAVAFFAIAWLFRRSRLSTRTG